MNILLEVWNIGIHFYNAVKLLSEGIDKFQETKENLEKIIDACKKLLRNIHSFLNKIINDLEDIIENFKNKIINRYNNRYTPIPYNSEFLNLEIGITQAINSRENCYILSSPKNIKDNLLTKILNKINQQNIQLVLIKPKDLKDITDEYAWYFKIIDIINDTLNLGMPSLKWNNKVINQSLEQKFDKYIKDNILYKHNRRVIIIFDEIETIFNSLTFQANFFDIVDRLYHQPYNSNYYRKLNFIFLGSAMINDDIYPVDKEITFGWQANFDDYFNPRRKIFDPELVRVDINKLSLHNILEYIFEYTEYSVLLTQHFIHLVIENQSFIIQGKEKKFVQKLYRQLIKNFEKKY
ncbi:MAG: AAA-like domain-containing protein [Cyanobacteria bacterium P01_A01_bin.83]